MFRNDQPNLKNFNFSTDSVFNNVIEFPSSYVPPTPSGDDFLLLDASDFLLLDGTNFELL